MSGHACDECSFYTISRRVCFDISKSGTFFFVSSLPVTRRGVTFWVLVSNVDSLRCLKKNLNVI